MLSLNIFTVKFRAFVVDSDLRPIDATVTYTVQDSKDNIILRKTNMPLTKGVHGDKLALSAKPVYGIYIIKFTSKVI